MIWHRVKLNPMVAAGKVFKVVGSGISITSTSAPIPDAALALRNAGPSRHRHDQRPSAAAARSCRRPSAGF